MAENDAYADYHKLPSFIKVFSRSRNKEGLRLPPLWVAEHGSDLPVDCSLLMPNGLNEDEEDNEVYTPDIDSSDDSVPSDVESEATDKSDYDGERGALDDDEYPTWTLKLTKSNTKRTIEIPIEFWELHIRDAPNQNVVHFLVDGQTWRILLKHSGGKIWVKHGWRRFKDANALFPGIRCNFKLVDAQDVHFYVWFDRP
ncbi:hypothetical protein SASPL_132553 [Salvia splendens]|uniref:TF-B3 domain-containing protein n=1 Tax=Salvia splendens TaxID=180675 RepID=A0A8X8X2F2_SALSN|nr:hypothetical protein SASPL_132553 [Salvia splendens]